MENKETLMKPNTFWVNKDLFKCKRCGRKLNILEHDYCPQCGQRIDWSDKEVDNE